MLIYYGRRSGLLSCAVAIGVVGIIGALERGSRDRSKADLRQAPAHIIAVSHIIGSGHRVGDTGDVIVIVISVREQGQVGTVRCPV